MPRPLTSGKVPARHGKHLVFDCGGGNTNGAEHIQPFEHVIHPRAEQDTGFSGCRRDIGKPNDPQWFWQQLGSSCEEVMQVGNGESSTCPPSSLYVNGASNFPAFLIKLLYNLPTIVAPRMTFDVMDHHVLLFLVGVVADFNWENGSLIVDNPHAQPVVGKPCK